MSGASHKLNRAGIVIPLVMLVVVLLLAVGGGLMALGFHSRLLGVKTCTVIAARSAADAGLTKAVFEMNEKLKVKPWDDSTLPQADEERLPGFDAGFDYTVTKNGGGSYTVRAVGTSGTSSRLVTSTLRLAGPFEFAIFARDNIELKNGTLVNQYNNDADDPPLQVGTNSSKSGAIILKNGCEIDGDVVVGVDGDPEEVIDGHSGATITGRTYAMTEKQVLPAVSVPGFLGSLASVGKIKNSTIISQNTKCDEIYLGNSESVVIDEPVFVYVQGDITLGNSAEIRVGGPEDTDDDACLTLYLAGNIEAKNSSGFNNYTKDAKKFSIYCLNSCEQIILKNSADFYGALYAPNAYVEMKNSADVYGSIVADSFILKNSATITYDASLRDRTKSDEAVRFVINRWQER